MKDFLGYSPSVVLYGGVWLALMVVLPLAGLLWTWYRYKRLSWRYTLLQQRLTQVDMEKMALQSRYEENLRLLAMTQEKVEKSLEVLCANALVGAQKSLVSLMDPLLSRFHDYQKQHLSQHKSTLDTVTQPLEKSLETLQHHLGDLEKNRVGSYETLREQVQALAQGQRVLSQETNALITALRTPHIRGCWGEMQLRRVVELAGMMPHCDFHEQISLSSDATVVRPDLCVWLTGGKCVLIDAKAPILYYLEASSAATTEEYRKKLQEHARLLRGHIMALAKKRYWSYAPASVEFTVLFLPGEAFLSAALEADASLLDFAAQKHIILSTPTMLIALLKTIAGGWRQAKLSQQTQAIIATAQDIHEEVNKLSQNLVVLGKHLSHGIQCYHGITTLLDTKIMPQCHKLFSMSPVVEQETASALAPQGPVSPGDPFEQGQAMVSS